MIKGKTLIELTDVKTGMVERFEDENIITDAAQLYTSAMTTVCGPNDLSVDDKRKLNTSKRLPLWNSTFGGIKLFESTIEERADNWHMPKVSQNKIIGYASDGTSDGTDPRRGSRNISETVAIDNGVQIVWDFATSEANGNISCVCLTSGEGGTFSYGIGEPKIPSIDNFSPPKYMLGYDKTEKLFYVINNTDLIMHKFNLFLDKLPFDKEFFKLYSAGDNQCNRGIERYSHYTGSDFAFVNASTDSSGVTTVYIYRNSKTDGSLTNQTLTLENIKVAANSGMYVNHRIFNEYLYLEKYGGNGYYKVDLSDTSNITEITLPENTSSNAHFIIELPNGDLATNVAVFDPMTGIYDENVANAFPSITTRAIEDLHEIDGFLSYIYKYTSSSSNYGNQLYIVPNNMMLHSINNLETPVTKTADKTMKITYTLTYTN